MARPSKFTPQKKQQIVLAVMRGELSIAEAARRFAASEGSIAKWRDLFVEGGVAALQDGAGRGGPSGREARNWNRRSPISLTRSVRRMSSCESQARRGRCGFRHEELEMMRQEAGLAVKPVLRALRDPTLDVVSACQGGPGGPSWAWAVAGACPRSDRAARGAARVGVASVGASQDPRAVEPRWLRCFPGDRQTGAGTSWTVATRWLSA